MVAAATINRPDVVALIEEAAAKLTDGNKTEAVALALKTPAGAERPHRLSLRRSSGLCPDSRRRSIPTSTPKRADRLLIATAIELDCAFVTYDERIVAFGRQRGWQHGFAVAT